MLKKHSSLLLGLTLLAPIAHASNNLSGGVWLNYTYLPDDKTNKKTNGRIGDEAFVLYANGEAEKGKGNWSYAAEFRVGPGSFTDKANNSTGDAMAMHQAWVGFDLAEKYKLIVGKSQVPFGWKTVNFWPGDMLQGGYGDQMDVGAKLTSDIDKLNYSVAYFLADDFGDDSTDTVDDNGHWGSSKTYRKVKTTVADLNYEVAKGHTIGFSAQSGKLQDLSSPSKDVDGSHSAWVIYYKTEINNFYANAEFMKTSRDLPNAYVAKSKVEPKVENQRIAAEFGYKMDKWNFYVDLMTAKPETKGNNSDSVYAIAPGVTYNYGPGWVYLEYLKQDGDIDRDGKVKHGDFSALYLTIDFYF
ncbi:porin [Parashewanella tropica]|uniref:porin n=1 Tax=Parashewanella tropica TaxID=2547970 RepID=UPI0010593122|nr:porin [Parashewanella tropica]